MLTEPRLSILNPSGIASRAKRAAVEAMFGGFYPAAIHVFDAKTKLDRAPLSGWKRRVWKGHDTWSRAELELLGAFVSARNGCKF